MKRRNKQESLTWVRKGKPRFLSPIPWEIQRRPTTSSSPPSYKTVTHQFPLRLYADFERTETKSDQHCRLSELVLQRPAR
jgi:hypothetical protein